MTTTIAGARRVSLWIAAIVLLGAAIAISLWATSSSTHTRNTVTVQSTRGSNYTADCPGVPRPRATHC